ncbi:hypothetical protein CISIN_1g039460mg, partial [Citrus sinensis]
CLEQERSALIQLKHFFNDNQRLQNWADAANDENYSNCCQWEAVEKATYECSLFTPFQQLESLDLIGNNIVGCVENEGLGRLSRLSNLKFLRLDFNSFNNSIFSSLGGLSSLRCLSLRSNRLNGSVVIKVFWFDILDENGLPFLEQTANRLSLESIDCIQDLIYLGGNLPRKTLQQTKISEGK